MEFPLFKRCNLSSCGANRHRLYMIVLFFFESPQKNLRCFDHPLVTLVKNNESSPFCCCCCCRCRCCCCCCRCCCRCRCCCCYYYYCFFIQPQKRRKPRLSPWKPWRWSMDCVTLLNSLENVEPRSPKIEWNNKFCTPPPKKKVCFACLFVCLFICLLVCLLVWLFVCLFVYLFACLFACLVVCLLVWLFVCLFV